MSKDLLISVGYDEELAMIIWRLKSLQDKIGAPYVLMRAINATARKVRKQMVQDAKGRYALSNKKVLQEANGGPKVLTATKTELEATIRTRGHMQDIMTFMTRPNTDTGAAAAKVLNASSMKELQKGDLKAFVTRFASGHVAVVRRTGPDRLPVEKLLSPSVPHMMNNEEIRNKATIMGGELLRAEIEKQIEKILERGA